MISDILTYSVVGSTVFCTEIISVQKTVQKTVQKSYYYFSYFAYLCKIIHSKYFLYEEILYINPAGVRSCSGVGIRAFHQRGSRVGVCH